MKKIKVLTMLALAAMLAAPAVFAQDAQADQNMPWRQLISAAGPYFHPEGSGQSVSVVGEKLDSGLGDLPPTYTASEYDSASHVRGEKLDSGLGELTQEDMQKWMAEGRVNTVSASR